MAINVTKPSVNLREKLNELDYGKVPFQKMPAGSVLQVVSVRNDTSTNTTSTSWVSTGTSASITPFFASSKILIISNEAIHGDVDSDSQTTVRGYYRLLRNSTTLLENNNGTTSEIISRGGQQGMQSKSIIYTDTPNTTSLTTYQTQAKYAGTASRNLRFNYDKLGSMTLMEIAQ